MAYPDYPYNNPTANREGGPADEAADAAAAEAALEAEYKNVGELVADNELPARLRAQTPYTDDANTQTDTGWWQFGTNTLNLPAAVAGGYGMGETTRYAGNWIRQRVQIIGSSDINRSHYERFTDGGAGWGQWYRLWGSEAELDARYMRLGADSGWILVGSGGAPAFLNSWVAFPGFAPPSFRKIGSRVTLRGLTKDGTFGTAVFMLPAGYRPASTEIFTSWTGAGSVGTRIDVDASNGGVLVQTGDSAGNVSLSGISFLVD